MRAGIVVQNNYPHDKEVRPKKMAKALNNMGHKVIIFSWNSWKKEKKENIGYAITFRFSYCLNSKHYLWLSHPSPLNPLWTFWITSIAKKEDINILIASNIRIALPTILAAKLLKIPVVLDLQENNPEAVNLRDKTSFLHHISRNKKIITFLERLCIRLCNHIWVVTEERLEDLKSQGVKKEKISVISNVPDLGEAKIVQNQNLLKGEKFTLIYVGEIEKIRGLDLILKSIPFIVKNDKKVNFLIVGDGKYRIYLENLVKGLEIDEYVKFIGWVNSGEVPIWLRKANIGVIPHQVNRFTNTTIPNKLFDYMAAGIPILATDMKPVKKVVEQEKCGVIIPLNSNYYEISDIILKLKNHPKQRNKMGERGRKAILKKYNWGIEFKKAFNTLKKIVNNEQ